MPSNILSVSFNLHDNDLFFKKTLKMINSQIRSKYSCYYPFNQVREEYNKVQLNCS